MRLSVFCVAFLFLLTACSAEDNREGWQRLTGKYKAPPGREAITEPVYCYRTLADANCYSTPQRGQESRLIGSFQPNTPVSTAPEAVTVKDVGESKPTVLRAPTPAPVPQTSQKPPPPKAKPKKEEKLPDPVILIPADEDFSSGKPKAKSDTAAPK